MDKVRLLPVNEVTDEYYEWLNDPEVTYYLEVSRQKVLTKKEFEKWIEKTNSDPNIRFWGIYLKKKFIGTIKLNIDWIHRTANIGIMIGDKKEWGKGYATKAIKLVKDYAFNILNLHKLWAGIYEKNTASQRAFLNAGFEQEGELKEHRFCDGEYTNQYIFGCINLTYHNLKFIRDYLL